MYAASGSSDAAEVKRGHVLLNARDIAALIRARDVLKRLEDAAWRRSLSHFDPYASVSAWDLGRLSDAAQRADDAIFHVLSTARHSCHLKITDAQLQAHGPAPLPTVGPSDAPTGPSRTPSVSPNGDSTAVEHSGGGSIKSSPAPPSGSSS